jgi:two-component system, cell cycle sensor histidine kinase and response regulator CckA
MIMAMKMEERILELETALATALAKLKESESTLAAFGSGDVDALVVSGVNGEEIHKILKVGGIADSLFNLVDNPTFIVDGNNHILQINKSGKKVFDPIRENTPFHEAVKLRPIGAKAGSARGKELPENWMSSGTATAGIDMAYQLPDGEIRYFQIDAKPIFNALGGFTGGLISLSDITDRKRAEIQSEVRNGQLRYQLQLTQSITDNVTQGLILMDQHYTVVLQNRASAGLFGLEENSLLGRPFFQRVRFEPDPDSPQTFPDFASGRPLNSGAQSFRAMLLQPDGTRIPTHCFHSILATGDGSILVISDIRPQLKAEKALVQSIEKQRQSQKMEAIGRLAGGIAHDFNNLLLAILGFTELSLMTNKVPAIHDNLTEVKKAGERAAVLTNQLLAYSRKQVIALKVRPINEVVESCRRLLERLIGENIGVDIDLSPLQHNASIDEAKIQQVLINIALNARDSMPSGGTVTIRTYLTSLDKQDDSGIVGEVRKEGGEGPPAGKYAVIEVRDSGHGMSLNTLDRLFEPFFTTKEFGKGSGLGLSTAYGIVRQMNGYIQVFSQVDTGSIFKILLPLVTGPVQEAVAPPTARPKPAVGETILVVEDETVVRKLIVQILGQQGYRVIEACNGVDALEKLEVDRPHLDLIVTDVLMDKMGGIELALNLKKPYPDVNVLFISGYAAEIYEFPESEIGESFFLGKPFSPVDFLKKIQTVLKLKHRSSGSKTSAGAET